MAKPACIIAFFLCFSSLSFGVCAEDIGTWPQWRGPNRDGSSVGVAWPKKLTMNSQWRIPLSPSYSTPIVTEDKVFTTETVNAKYEAVTAVDRQTGKRLWRVQWEGAMSVPFFAKENGDWIRSTPACDGESLYVAGMRDVLICLRTADGGEKWRLDIARETGASIPSFGCVCSPLVDGNHVYMQAGGALIKIEKEKGSIIWKKLADGGGMNGGAFSSPVIAELNGQRQLVVQTRKSLAGIDIESGATLWSQDVPAFRGMNILTPTIYGDSVFTSMYGGGSYLINPTTDGKTKERWSDNTQ